MYEQVIPDYNGGTKPIYIGFGDRGLLESETGWLIYKLTYNADSSLLTKKTSLGSYDSRGTLTYT